MLRDEGRGENDEPLGVQAAGERARKCPRKLRRTRRNYALQDCNTPVKSRETSPLQLLACTGCTADISLAEHYGTFDNVLHHSSTDRTVNQNGMSNRDRGA